jgi:hypothetical protein
LLAISCAWSWWTAPGLVVVVVVVDAVVVVVVDVVVVVFVVVVVVVWLARPKTAFVDVAAVAVMVQIAP